MAAWGKLKTKSKSICTNFGEGVNTYLDQLYIGVGETVDCLNMCSDSYPAIEVRKDRTKTSLPLLTTPKMIGKRSDSTFYVIDGTTLKYALPTASSWTTVTGTLNSYKGTTTTFKTQVKEYTIIGNLDDSSDVLYAWDGSNLINLTTDAPKSNMYTSHKYRLYGINSDKRTLKHSAQGDITDWTTSLDAGSIDITNAQGDATAIRTFQDHVIVWCNNSMHELYGTSASDFSLVDVSNELGCVNQTSHIECNGQLFWLDYSGVYLYTGGLPSKISSKVQEYISNINWTYKSLICFGSLEDKIYINIPYKSTINNRILVYDTVKQKWFIEDGNFIQFVNIDEKLYGLDSSGYIWNMVANTKTGYDSGTVITWNFTSKPIRSNSNTSLQSTIREMWLDHQGTSTATINLGYTKNISDSTFTDIITNSDFTSSNYTHTDRKIVPFGSLENLSYIQFKIYGTGYQKINSLLLDVITFGDNVG
jgi:hypothetical protein